MNIALLHKILLILWPALFFLNDSVMGQFKMGDQSTKNRFTVVKSDSNLTRQWYKPKTDKVVFYNGVTGKKDYLSRWDAIYIKDIQKGTWSGKTGKWARFNEYDFVWFDHLENYNQEYIANIEQEKRNAVWALQVRFERELSEFIKIAGIVLVALTIVIILLVRYYRNKTKCPNCTAPRARKKLGDKLIDKKTVLTTVNETRYVSSNRWNASEGRYEGGNVTIPVLKKRTTYYYVSHYQCKYCKHKWTKSFTRQSVSDAGNVEIEID